MECNGQPTNLIADVFSASGDAMTVTWTVNGIGVQTNLVPPGSTTNVAVVLSANLELGTNIVAVTAADSVGQSSCESTIVVQDTIPPVIINKTLSPAKLWPPNHKFIPINISVATRDACCVDKWKIISVTSNEPVSKSKKKNNVQGQQWQRSNDNDNENGNGSGEHNSRIGLSPGIMA